jgi:hypothetical protein
MQLKCNFVKKSNMIDYIYTYDEYITLYKCPICN